ncbi:MAG: hypothetical protein HC896_07150 [Bacteroidales bacterium]|nr:hypothetical protein [Bacteroidales bacterium]
MQQVNIDAGRIKDFLAKRLALNVLQLTVDELFDVLRYETLGGFESMSQGELFELLTDAIPEFKLTNLRPDSSPNSVTIVVNPDFKGTEDEVLVDIRRIVQTKF